MSQTTNQQNVFLNSKYRENGFKWNPQFQLPSTLLRTDEDDQFMHLCLVDAEIPYTVYNIFQYNNAPVYPCAEDPTIDANNNFEVDIQVELSGTLPNPYNSNLKFQLAIPMGNYNVLDMSVEMQKQLVASMEAEWIASGGGGVAPYGLPQILVSWNFNLGRYIIEFRIRNAGDKVLPVDGAGNLSEISFPYDNTALPLPAWTTSNNLRFNRTAWRWMGATDCNNPSPLIDAATPVLFGDTTANLPAPIGPNESMSSLFPLMGNIGLPRFIGVRLDVITRNVGHQHGQGQPEQIEHSTLIGKIMTTAPNGDTLKYLNINDDFKVVLGDKYLNNIRISLTDEYNLPLYIQNDFQICIRVDFVSASELHRDLLGELIYLNQVQIMGTKELVQEAQRKDKILE